MTSAVLTPDLLCLALVVRDRRGGRYAGRAPAPWFGDRCLPFLRCLLRYRTRGQNFSWGRSRLESAGSASSRVDCPYDVY